MRREYLFVPLVALLLFFAGCQYKSERLYLRAEQHRRLSQYEEAANVYEQILSKYQDDSLAENAMFEAANLYYHHLRRTNRAIELYQQLLYLYPKSKHANRACLKLGDICEFEMRDLHRAIGLWERVVKDSSQSPENLLEIDLKIADAYFKLNDFENALPIYQRVAENEPSHLTDQANLKTGAIYQMLRHFHSSLRPLLRVASESNCDQCKYAARVQLIEAYENLEEFDKAIDAVKELDPKMVSERYRQREIARLRRQKLREDARPKIFK